MIAPRVIACNSANVQGTRAAIAEVAAIMNSHVVSRSVTEPTCWITGLRFITVVRELGCKVQGTSGACIEFDHARYRLSSCEGKAKDDVRAPPGLEESSNVPVENACAAIIRSGSDSPTHGAVKVSRGAAARCSEQEGSATRAGLSVGGSKDAARALEAQAPRPPTHASDCGRASQGAR